VKAELEDLAFKYLESDDYKQLAKQVKARRVERDRTIERMRSPLAEELQRAGIAGWEIVGRPKNLWSIFKKMKKRGKPFEEIYDLLAVRVLVNSITDCYHVLGIIHHTWTPLQERIKDYIASPKSNGYQSLHTTVFGRAAAVRDPDPYPRHASHGGVRHRGALALQGERQRRRRARPPSLLVPPADRAAAGRAQPRGIPRVPQDRPVSGRDFRLHSPRRREAAPQGRDADRFRVHGAHRGGPALQWGAGERPHRRRSTARCATATRSKCSPARRPSLARLAGARADGRARQKIRQWIKQEEQERSVTLGREILAREVRRRRLDPPTAEQLEQAAQKLGLGAAEQVETAIGRGMCRSAR